VGFNNKKVFKEPGEMPGFFIALDYIKFNIYTMQYVANQ
jgi:hypothetical protein